MSMLTVRRSDANYEYLSTIESVQDLIKEMNTDPNGLVVQVSNAEEQLRPSIRRLCEGIRYRSAASCCVCRVLLIRLKWFSEYRLRVSTLGLFYSLCG